MTLGLLIALAASEGVALVALLYSGMWRRYYALPLYAGASLLFTLLALRLDPSSAHYVRLYGWAEGATVLCHIALMNLLCRRTKERYPGLRVIYLFWVGSGAVLGALTAIPLMLLSLSGEWRYAAMQYVMAARLITDAVIVFFGMVIVLGTRVLRNQFSLNYLRYRAALLFYCGTTVTVYAASLLWPIGALTPFIVMALAGIAQMAAFATLSPRGEAVAPYTPRFSQAELERAEARWEAVVGVIERRL